MPELALVGVDYRAGSSRRVSSAVIRRRRVTTAAIAIVALVSLVNLLPLAMGVARGMFGGGPLATSEHSHPQVGAPLVRGTGSTKSVVAEPGDTLWSIARRIQPDGDVRPLVDELASRRRGATIQVGERIVL